MKTAKAEKTTKKSRARYVVVEVPIGDAWMAMYVGEFVKRTKDEIVLKNPCFVKDTGRRSKFFAGTPDSSAEWEPSGPISSFPSNGAIVTEWPHSFAPFMESK